MLPDPKRWDEDLLEDMFEGRDRKLILRIPLHQSQLEDKLVWAHKISRSYFVKSAYKLLQKDKGAWRPEEEEWLWQKFWKLKTPPKIKNLVWHACTECLPTTILLRQKMVQVDSLCPVCLQYDETILHCLVDFPLAQLVWQRTSIGTQRRDSISFRHWLEEQFRRLDAEKQSLLAVVCWALWGARNDKLWNNKQLDPSVIFSNASSYLTQWNQAQVHHSEEATSGLTPSDGATVWIPPLHNALKVNVDGSTFDDLNGFRLGIVVRDCTGCLVAGRTRVYNGRAPPEVVEALGIQEALSWIKDMNWHNTTLESDCLVAIQALRSSIIMRSWFGEIIVNCKSLLKELPFVNVIFVKQSANTAAHSVARAAASYPDCNFDLGNILFALLSSLVTDVDS